MNRNNTISKKGIKGNVANNFSLKLTKSGSPKINLLLIGLVTLGNSTAHIFFSRTRFIIYYFKIVSVDETDMLQAPNESIIGNSRRIGHTIKVPRSR